jgi:cobalamin biosynthesis Co2+ chelatase CbiK
MAMMQMLLDASMPEAFADEAFARYLARQAKDYIALHNMNKAIGLKKLVDSTSKQADTPPQIVINITGDGFQDQEVQTSFEVLEAETVDDD